MKIYTKTGDDGSTGLFGGERVSKSSTRVDAYGAVDELNSVLGVARSQSLSPRGDEFCNHIQHTLFHVGAELATVPGKEDKLGIPLVSEKDVGELEGWIDSLEVSLAPLTAFILPGGSPAASTLHLARTVCRRAERETVRLATAEPIGWSVVTYLNRLSDFLFVLARFENAHAGVADVPWKKR